MRTVIVMALLALAGCEEPPPPVPVNGRCALYSPLGGPIQQAYNAACLSRLAEEQARAAGGTVTRCLPTGGGGVSCTSS